jgi:hypothetical protein
MASRQWFTGRGGKQDGPYSDEQLRDMIASGSVTADTLVWSTGMSAWARAGEVPGLMSAARPPAMPPGAAPPTAYDDGYGGAYGGAHATGPLSTHVGVWPLLGRAIVVAIAQITIIPAPWVLPSFYKWFVERIDFPGQQRVSFAGKPGDIWYIFILNALTGYAGLIHNGLQLLVLPLTVLFLFIIVRWFLRNLVWDGQAMALNFTGSYWPMLGWYLLLLVSFISIVGWAWVATAWTRWMCSKITGSERQLVFTASGGGYLWRTLVLVVTCIFIIPIPWMMCWFTRWLISQFALVERT